MLPSKTEPMDQKSADALAALRRGVEKAREESIRTGTPFYIWRDGRVVDLNAPGNAEATNKGDVKS